MNYKKLYDRIIENRKQAPFDGYVEKHHIVPKSLGGDDSKENLVALSAREHFICHYILTRIYEKESFEWYKMVNAFLMMKCVSVTQDRYFNSRLYETIKDNRSSLMRIAQIGENNSQFGTMWICNVESKENKKIPKDSEIPNGWVKGRNKWNDIEKSSKEQKHKKKVEDVKTIFEDMKRLNVISASQYCKIIGTSQVNLSKKLKKYLPDYEEYFQQGFLGKKHSEETKKKISDNMKK